jgi:hypothetical protein
LDTPRSLFAFTFRLLPWEATLGLNFDRQELAPDFNAVCIRDQLKIVWVGDPAQNDISRDTAITLARRLVHANSFLAHPAPSVYDAEPVSWLEVTGVTGTTLTAGYMSPSLGGAPLSSADPQGVRLKSAAELVRKIGGSGTMSMPLYMALADFHAARMETGPYAVFFAFRVLEDVGYAFGSVANDKPNWDAMNAAIGTTKAEWDKLTQAGIWARHLNDSKLISGAPLSKSEALQLAHTCLKKLLTHAKVV